eukprot:scaffold1638_cov258-Pinguiococcus_pyrenoidosus.AAC.78
MRPFEDQEVSGLPPPPPPLQPNKKQLRDLFFAAAVPMVGFGFMDNTVMILAGDAIDSTIGVRFGLATMTAAAFGEMRRRCRGFTAADAGNPPQGRSARTHRDECRSASPLPWLDRSLASSAGELRRRGGGRGVAD